MKETKSKKKRIIIPVIILCALALLTVGWGALSVSIYNENFDQHFESYEPLLFRVEDFDGLERTRYEFPSDRGQMLTGYMYGSGEGQRGIIVIAHGFGGGHNSYMDAANFFAHKGYYVFAYDATACDESGGGSLGGVPQGVIDLDNAITFVEKSGNFPELPIVLFGHSWGGYGVSAVLTYHPEVKAVIECCGFNSSAEMFESGGRQQAPGAVIDAMLPFIKLHERIKFGKYASNTALDGFAASEAAIMVVHSADDGVIPIEYGYDKYYEKYKDDPRFEFVRYENKGHNYIFDDTAYLDELDGEFGEWVKTLDYDYASADNIERFKADKADYLRRNLDRARYSDMLDKEMFTMFADFYDEHI